MAVSDTPSQPITPAKTAEHIRALSALNEDVPALLQAAGTAISALTNRPLPSPPASPSSPSSSPQDATATTPLAAHKAAFTTSTQRYFTLISHINSTLTSQVSALEEAGIIPAEAPRLGLGDAGEGVVNGGLGALDPGWLNARMGGGVEGKEEELLRGLREGLEGELGRREGRREVEKEKEKEGEGELEAVKGGEGEKMEDT